MITIHEQGNVYLLPGDELIPCPKKTITHVAKINASPEQIWPWLVQMGAGRAGWYSYNRVDNGGRASAEQIIPAWQHLTVGDILPAIPNAKDGFIVMQIDPCHALVLVVPIQTAAEEPNAILRMKGPLRVSWALILKRINPQSTELISRGRISEAWLKPSVLATAHPKKPIFIERVYSLLGRMPWWLMAPIALAGHYLMEARMLQGIKKRAETLAKGTEIGH
ncbi:MAG: hypothetical protein ACXVBI_13440 [Flavisolibacter sp.]